MRRLHSVQLLCWLCAAATLLLPAATPSGNKSKYGMSCDLSDLEQLSEVCGPYERCKQENASSRPKCICLQGYEFIDTECRRIPTTRAVSSSTLNSEPEPDSTGSQGGSWMAFVLIPACLVLLGAGGYVGARKYKWLQQLQQFRQNRYGSVLVTRDDTDEDDPPGLA